MKKWLLRGLVLLALAVVPGLRVFTWVSTIELRGETAEAEVVLRCLASTPSCVADAWVGGDGEPGPCAAPCRVESNRYRYQKREGAWLAHGQKGAVYGDTVMLEGEALRRCYSVVGEQRNIRFVPKWITGSRVQDQSDACVDANVAIAGF